MYSILTSYFYMVIPGKYAINYYICAGLNPDVDPYDGDKVLFALMNCFEYPILIFLF